MKKLRWLLLLPLIVLSLFFIGPKPPVPQLNNKIPEINFTKATIEEYLKQYDSGIKVKPDNESRILWANDSLKNQTEYALLYLHGFSASWYEGFPAHFEFASTFSCNLYIPRLASHGIDTPDPLLDMTPDRLWESAKEALLVARKIGKKVIIMSTSTGGTLSLKLAADFPELVDALILFSPNIAINNSAAFILDDPWGLQVGRLVAKSDYRVVNTKFESKECQYWYCKYRVEGIVYLQQFVEETMKKATFKKVKAPVFLGYYYKDEENQDNVVRVDAMLKMFDNLGTPLALKRKVAFPNAGDHVIACELKSKSFREVISETVKFGNEILKLTETMK